MSSLPQCATPRVVRIARISKILVLEHLKEPTALLWTALSPCIMFIILTQSTPTSQQTSQAYITAAAWFYAYISSSVAFFGLSFYLIGRRESGFIRSFIYQKTAIALFLCSHLTSYTLISIIYFSFFYLTTKPLYGDYSTYEFLYLLSCFYASYLMFSCIGLAIAALPIKFTTANTLFSLLSFIMLLSGYIGAMHTQDIPSINPLHLSTKIFHGEISLINSFLAALTSSLLGSYLTGKYFRIQPIWSRY